MTTAYKSKENPNVVKIVVKGAPEYIIPNCVTELDSNNDSYEFDGAGPGGAHYLEDVVSNMIATLGEKPILYATKEMDAELFEEMKRNNDNFETEQSRLVLEQGLTLVACFGLSDKLREDVIEVINDLHDANTNTRILSGDHRDAVFHCARELGVPIDNAISGEEFREQIAHLLRPCRDERDGGSASYEFVDDSAIKTFKTMIK